MNIVIGIIGLGIIVFVHEMGHYLAARYHKVHVLEFAVGMGPVLYSFFRGREDYKTKYSIRILPLGGFCTLKPPSKNSTDFMSPKEIPSNEEGTLAALSFGKKIFVLFAGPLANIIWYLLLSFILFSTNYKTQGLPAAIDPIKDLSAYSAGLQQADTITHIADVPIHSFAQMAYLAKKNKGKEVALTFIRNGIEKNIFITLHDRNPVLGVYPFIFPRIILLEKSATTENITHTLFQNDDVIVKIENKAVTNAVFLYQIFEEYKGEKINMTVLRNNKEIDFTFTLSEKNPFAVFAKAQNIGFASIKTQQWYSFPHFISSSISQIGTVFYSTAKILIRLSTFKTKQISQETMGPLRIISFVGSNTISNIKTNGVSFALLQFIRISALLSLAIAVMNLIPIPILDGGQIMFYTFYAIRRKQPTYRSTHYFQLAGTVIMLFIFALVLFGDVSYIIKGFM